MLEKIIKNSYLLLFLLTPLIWTPLNYELFEFNKMIFVYLITTVILTAWLIKSINAKRLTISRTPLDLPILLFLAANIISTIISIDRHTSIWGYYSRSNGGLLSIISYTLLFFAATSNLAKEDIPKLLKTSLLGGVIVSVWGIFEHFGVSPSCVILHQEFTANCWVQDVQARVFATLGQPNWMAGYLSMLIFPALYFVLTATNRASYIRYILYSVLFYLGLTFTYSRGPTIGLIAGLIVFLNFYLRSHLKGVKLNNHPLVYIMGIFLAVNLLFGSALTSFKLISKFAAPSRPTVNLVAPSTTQLENGGTESWAIRLIVWRGALDIFRHYPIFGSGVETFAYSYYQFRPLSHNLTSEWDFLYNKAHNEYLNYLANTGIVGFGSYMFLIGTFLIWNLRQNKKNLLVLSLLASYISYLVHNFSLFSVVITATFFYLFPALSFISTGSLKVYKFQFKSFRWMKPVVAILAAFILSNILKIWYADTIFAKGMNSQAAGSAGKAYNYLKLASSLNKGEPFYLSELSFAASSVAVGLKETDATTSAQLKETAVNLTEKVLNDNPKNTSFYRTAIRTYFQLSDLDPSYVQKSLEILDKTITLAPTDAKLYYNKAIILGQIDKVDEAVDNLKKAIELKPNYRDAYYALSLFYFDRNQKDLAVESLRKVLEISQGDPEALQQLNDWGKQGIATNSANQ